MYILTYVDTYNTYENAYARDRRGTRTTCTSHDTPLRRLAPSHVARGVRADVDSDTLPPLPFAASIESILTCVYAYRVDLKSKFEAMSSLLDISDLAIDGRST